MQLEYISAFLITLVVTLLVMPGVIRFLHKIKFGQTEREEGLASHKVKNGTPTMAKMAPMGISLGAMSVRASTSASSMNRAPPTMEAGMTAR